MKNYPNLSFFHSFIFLLLFLSLNTGHLLAQPESYYSTLLAKELNGVTEHKVDGGRVDILTSTHAIEVKRASDWKHTIGQALWYGLQTNKIPGIILIMKTSDDYKHGIRLQSALDYAGLSDVKVWFYPQDFGGTLTQENRVEKSYLSQVTALQNSNAGCVYWVNTGSKKNTRHNQSCRYYNNTKRGRCTDTKEGSACGKCGG